ncbi:MAG: LamG-like jellyroll fold domain-containing protein [Candidatus Spyradenecus sp.]
MKLKQTFLLAVGAVLSVFCVGHAYAAELDSYLQSDVRIEAITKRVSKNAAAQPGARALGPGDTVYFDVKLKDVGTAFSFGSNSFDKTTSGAIDRPYLELAIPLRGQSTKNGIADTELATGEAKSVETETAVAYYIGPGSDAATLRFAYEVRPGDMTELLTWSTVDGTADGEPIFGGTLAAIRVTGYLNTVAGQQTAGLTAQTLTKATGADLSTENTTRPWSASGYLFSVGASFQDGALVENDQDLSYGSLYQGLTPVTISTRDGAPAAAFQTTALASKCYFWVEAKDATDTWKFVPAGVTALNSDNAEIKAGDFTAALADAFSATYAAKFNGPTKTTATAFTAQTFFVNIPASVAAGTQVRLCYGVRRDTAGSTTLFASQEFELQASPVIEAPASGYTVESYEMTQTADGNITLPEAAELGTKYAALAGQPVRGGELKIAAGDPAVSVTISKSNLGGYGTVYASVEMISAKNSASSVPNRYYVPLDPQSATDYTLTLSVKENATGGDTYYRICVPQLEAMGNQTVDEPFYLKVTSSRKRAKISLTVGDTGSLGKEYVQGSLPADYILKYTLSVEKTEASTRYFKIAPVTSDNTFIPEDAVFADGTGRRVHDALKEYAGLQRTASGTIGSSTLVLTLPSNAASADFYIACMNDLPQEYLSGAAIEWTEGGTTINKTLPAGGLLLSAASCSNDGSNVNALDICEVMAQPDVANVAPVINSASAPTGGSTGIAMNFSFSFTDATADYLVAKMDFGEGNPEFMFFADEARMVALMGQIAWDAKVAELERDYGAAAGSFADGGANRKSRNAKGAENAKFSKVYSDTASPAWFFAVYDPSSAMDTRSGTFTLTTSQIFTFYTTKNETRPGTGYVRWAGDTTTPDDAGFTWSFGKDYTWAGKAKSGSNTTVMVEAIPFAAGANTPAGYTAISTVRDSFFYKWGARHTDYAALLPTDAKYLYESTLALNRAFVSGGGQATDSTQWQDIILEAVFDAEYLPGDAYTAFAENPDTPYLYALGDYNSDGVPDGWLLRNVGADDAGRAVVESTSSQANVAADGDNLPIAGWGIGDAAYRLGSSDGRLTTEKPCDLSGSPFGYKLRIRGRDDALNAADGQGNWLSNPAWVVLMHPEGEVEGDLVVIPAKRADEKLVTSWKQVRLNTSGQSEVAGVTVAFTAANRIPYNAADVAADGWAPVIDEAGNPIKAGSEGYALSNMMVQTLAGDDNYECFRYTYTKWAIDDTLKSAEDGALFPFTTVADTDAAMASGKVNEYTGAEVEGTYYFVDARVPNGLLIDEPFYVDDAHLTNGALDPRKTSWLERFNGLGADQDGDGIKNGAEYYFWYYASRIAWASVYADDDGHIQVNEALWPAIDLRNRVVNEDNPLAANRDVDFATIERFTMGRRYRSGYDPDAEDKAYFTFDDNDRLVTHDEATFGKGNYWEPIPAETVLAAFNPYAGPSTADPDNDGLITAEEFAIGTNPIDCDTDNDWMLDGWEVRADLDPLNLNGKNDASANPDKDFFARAIVKPYATFHHLFKATVATPAPVDPDNPPDPDAAPDPNADSPFTAHDTGAYYYDYELSCFYYLTDTQAGGVTVELPTDQETISWADGKDYVTAWDNAEPLVAEVPGKPRIIRDFEVYKAFGFDFRTAWIDTKKYGTAILGKISALGNAVNTIAFSNREEFNYYVKSGHYIDPKSTDTNGDGCPDGWEAYVGLRPYVVEGKQDGATDWDCDGLTAAEEFQCRLSHLMGEQVLWPDSLQNITKYDTTWVNKVFPIDPWNPDTDFDGIWDGKEGASAYTYSPSDGSVKGGGCDPMNIDTDGDGMPDGWEYCYGKVATTTTTTEEGETVTTTTTASILGPDPTDPNDYDYDYDRDGLTQYQEYFTGLLRQNRYDLGPNAARIYKDFGGELTTHSGATRWKTIPSVYNATVDLLNPVEVPSADYEYIATILDGSLYETFTVNPLRQAIANTEPAAQRRVCTATNVVEEEIFAPAITDAYNRLWSASIIFPSDLQLEDYGLNPKPDEEASEETQKAYDAVNALRRDIDALDAAWMRALARSTDTPNNPLFTSLMNEPSANTISQIYALIARIDAAFATLEALGDAPQPVIQELVAGDSKTLWTARKAQIYKALEDAFTVTADPIYVLMADRSADSGAVYAYTPAATTTPAAEYSEYEEKVAAATSPLIQELYRAATRGYVGGVVVEENSDNVYLAPLGIHMPMRTVDQRKDFGATVFLGLPITNKITLGAQWPSISVGGNAPFLTTSPLVADSDMDGMDDYWEVFHGINPTLGDYASELISNDSDTNYSVDRLGTIYTTLVAPPRSANNNVVYSALAPSILNPFGNESFEVGRVTGYDYYSYPWLAGVPFADPDGDGLLNFEEAVNPSAANPAHYGTDPSPLWMTDPDNPNSFVARFYTRLNANTGANITFEGATLSAEAMRASDFLSPVPFTFMAHVGDAAPLSAVTSVEPYEINEGYDTDGDGIGDMTELSSSTIYRGDPQTLRTPDRQQAAYFGGEGVMQSHITTQFGPMALTTFTLECWVKPDADNGDETILIDRPWRFNEGAENLGDIRYNFVLGLRKEGSLFKPFAYYTGAGTTADVGLAPQVSPTVTCGEGIKAGEWNHVAVVYDGSRLSIVLNGVENAAVSSSLIPANGVLSLKNDGLDDVQRFTFRNAPILIGAEPKFETSAAGLPPQWVPDLGDADSEATFAQIYKNAYKGFIDEVRIWNGARTPTQINEKRRSGFTQAELLAFRLAAFNARYSGGGYYENDVPVYPVAIYTFNDLLAGARIPADDTTGTPAAAADAPWERYPGEKLVGGDDTPGSFTYRRTGFRATKGGNNMLVDPDSLPEEAELFTSFYTLTAPKNLRSSRYNTAAAGLDPQSEFVPMAHNTIDHLPVADIERATPQNYLVQTLTNGSPSLTMPSGAVENLKAVDSVYWSPYAAGREVEAEKTYNVKTTGNPYGYRYLGVQTFDMDSYTVRAAFTTRYAGDLLIYGDAFAKYDFESWDNSPSTDPSAGSDDGTGGGAASRPSGSDWFDYASGSDTNLTDKQYSKGGAWLEENIAVGQTKDSDSDRMPNWWENYYGLDPEDPTGSNGPHGDDDGDFLTNYAEYLAKADPTKYSTVGNGVPDYHAPIWFRRGRPTFGLLYTDNDFMEDHWEAENRSNLMNVDTYDAQGDADGDGWSNWAEARANFKSGRHSTDPNKVSSVSKSGEVIFEMPTPALRLTVDYFGSQDAYTNATENAKILVHAYTAKNNNSAPDATFKLPLSTSAAAGGENGSLSQTLNYWNRGILEGYLHMGNVVPGSVNFVYTRAAKSTSGNKEEAEVSFTLSDDETGSLVYTQKLGTFLNGKYSTVTVSQTVGTVDYDTGKFTVDFTDETFWTDNVYTVTDSDTTTADGGSTVENYTFYKRTEFEGVVSYKYAIIPGTSNTFTLVKPDSGYLKEGANNFFVFADLNGNGEWNDGEPAGVPDQHDVDIGFDQVNKPLHVALTTKAPPGSVRLDAKSILGVLITENNTNDAVTGDNSSITNPTTGQPLQPSLFNTGLDYYLVLTEFENVATGTPTTNPGAVVYKTLYNTKKPYLTEDEIFGYNASGLPGTDASNQKAASYKVYLLPSTVDQAASAAWTDYNIAVVTNHFSALDVASTKLVSPIGGALRGNTELTFEWLSNVQVPTFTLKITKVEDALGNPANTVVYEKQVRGVTPCAVAKGAEGSLVEQFTYRYQLPRGLGELNAAGNTVFGDGLYDYTLSLNPYNGSARVLSGSFRIQLTDSGDPDLREVAAAEEDTSWNTQDSFYVRAKIRYTGVLAHDDDFGGRRLMVEAHYSGSFNGDPVASTSDILVYDKLAADGSYADTETLADGTTASVAQNVRNRCVRMVRDRFYPDGATVENAKFFGTRFDAELRGLPTADPVYLVAYFDLNGNGKRDAWEPWGYATQGLDATSGFYFDPLSVKPVNNGRDYQVEFYIQDVDTDNDKLADSWEWVSAGKPTEAFDTWCGTFNGTLANHNGTPRASDIWTVSTTGTLSLTAYGAQLYGLKATSAPDANGAVRVEGMPEDLSTAQELMEMMDPDVALSLTAEGYTSYGLTVKSISFADGTVTLAWDVTAALGVEDGATYDLTQVFADKAATSAVYAVYGKANLGDEAWTKLGEVKVANLTDPAIELPADQIQIDGQSASFFRVILSAKTAEATLAD